MTTKYKPYVCFEDTCFSERTYGCARRIFEYIMMHRRKFVRNVLAGDGELKLTTTRLMRLIRKLCNADPGRGGRLGRLIKAIEAVAREEGFEVDYIISSRPTKTEKRIIFLKPKPKARKKMPVSRAPKNK